MTSTVEVLRQARELYARAPSHAGDGEAVPKGCFCPLYALLATVGGYMDDDYIGAEWALRRAAQTRFSIVRWNAENSTETVLAAFDRAIEAEASRAAVMITGEDVKA